MKRIAIVTIALLTGAACGSGSSDAETAEPLTQAQKDSIVGNLPVPGASGVIRAMSAVEQANARAEQHDTIR
jgi:hypothetical protein